jgi:peroxiredoxin Q/BCP
MLTTTIPRPAPLVAATLDDGTPLDLGSLYSKGPVLVYFYPRSGTPGCTRQACNLRDNFSALTGKGVQVIGVSRDSVKAQAGFRAKQALPFRLVADKEGLMGEAFGVPRPTGNGYARMSFLVVGGMIVWVQQKARPDSQAADALAALEGLCSSSTATILHNGQHIQETL